MIYDMDKRYGIVDLSSLHHTNTYTYAKHIRRTAESHSHSHIENKKNGANEFLFRFRVFFLPLIFFESEHMWSIYCTFLIISWPGHFPLLLFSLFIFGEGHLWPMGYENIHTHAHIHEICQRERYKLENK